MVEILSKLADVVVAREQISGFKIVEGGASISHLQLAEDTLLFVNASIEEIRKKILILSTFEILTGMKINLEKSSMIIVSTDSIINSLASKLGCKVESLLIKYLGLPLGATSRNASVWDEVVHRIETKLALWKKKFLSA